MRRSIHLEEISISERCAQAEDEVPLGMFGYWLHDGAIDDDQVLGSGFYVPSLARVARVEEQSSPFEADPVSAPAALAGQFHLMFLAQQPFLHAQEAVRNANKK